MSKATQTTPVEDTVAKVNDEFAVGSDPHFQHRWIRMERIVWILLIVLLTLSAAGLFGRGPLAQAHARSEDGSLNVRYERVQRFGTPSVMTVDFDSTVIQDGKVQLWVEDTLVKPLGTQRVVPQPIQSIIGAGGILYTFPATTTPASVQFQTQPSALGASSFTMRVPGKQELKANVFVMP